VRNAATGVTRASHQPLVKTLMPPLAASVVVGARGTEPVMNQYSTIRRNHRVRANIGPTIATNTGSSGHEQSLSLPSLGLHWAAFPFFFPISLSARSNTSIAAPSSGRHGGLPQRAIGLLEQLKRDNRPPFRRQSASPSRGRFAMLREREVDPPEGGVIFLHCHVR
jgi:hypothetical protein